MLFGAHVSIAGGILKTPLRAKKIGCEVFQSFVRNPRGGKPFSLTPLEGKMFRALVKRYGLKEYYVHAPYFINLASSNNRIFYGSIASLKEDLAVSNVLGAKYYMTHLGSAKDLGEKKALKKIIDGLNKVLKEYKGKTMFLLELSAGAGKIMGDTLEEFAKIFQVLEKYSIGLCLDTCHAFASGYDLRNSRAVEKFLLKLDATIGLERLKLMHGNDSKYPFGSHKDQHAHIGKGKIGLQGFRALINNKKLKKVNMIIEVPNDGKDAEDLALLKKLREGDKNF